MQRNDAHRFKTRTSFPFRVNYFSQIQINAGLFVACVLRYNKTSRTAVNV